jgi:hypothetical protein
MGEDLLLVQRALSAVLRARCRARRAGQKLSEGIVAFFGGGNEASNSGGQVGWFGWFVHGSKVLQVFVGGQGGRHASGESGGRLDRRRTVFPSALIEPGAGVRDETLIGFGHSPIFAPCEQAGRDRLGRRDLERGVDCTKRGRLADFARIGELETAGLIHPVFDLNRTCIWISFLDLLIGSP